MRKVLQCASAAILLASAASAGDCGPLISYGAVPLTHLEGHASEFVPVEIDGIPKLMLLDTGASITVLKHSAAEELRMTIGRGDGGGVYDVTGKRSLEYTKAPIKIGNLKGEVTFMLGTSYLDDYGDDRVVGLLGADILRKFDVSIDYGAHTFAMFNQNHCDGQVIYWTERPVAVVPFKLVGSTDIVFPVTLDGKEVKAQLDTGASTSTLVRSRAEGRFDLVLGSADTPSLGKPGGLAMWRHRFKTLSFSGLDVNNPDIDIIADQMTEGMNNWTTGSLLDRKAAGYEQTPMLIGMNVLKHLRIYIAYGEKKLYISPASTPAPATAPPAK